ncbi:cyclic nucleotide-binding domain-containing protein [Pseudooceanicola aestuarii]|uniref:cyclic nucleotide-binding domain-containing protein n=1 Tax=Pseudooceanicola aestuarii TaxID=2697319 RepID=UPI0013D52433|nr:cyclic nucleotide-binding domain-containing protein [Pseudooceanicola aestuarii]
MTLFIETLGWLAAGLTIASYAVKTMLPLRVMAILSSLFFVTYAMLEQLWPMVLMELVLLPFNSYRLWEILSLRRRLTAAPTEGPPDFSVIADYAPARNVAAGTQVFAKGDAADGLYYIASGEILIEEIGITIGAGEIFGEIAFFTDAAQRSASVRTTCPARLHRIDEKTFLRLHFQDPVFGMAVMKTLTRRLIDGMARNPATYTDLIAVSEDVASGALAAG